MMSYRLSSFLPLILATTLFSFLYSCKPYQPEGQGITGTITWVEGNLMPRISESGDDAPKKPEGIQRKLEVYPLVKISDMKMEDGLFVSLAVKPIAQVETDANGKYSLQLSPGRYSVFTVEEGGLFANIFDGEGNAMPVTVKEGEWTLVDIQINYKAVY
ncbi:carboxypeptidase regulatory-like domain-containing protein [Algoriphagus taiwanensis]|uniref:Carboxypeptidase regulatory-like domain-containing protein n=1 Tax=Algoriphagus taiwanensis TaxID=1445656 RepID=A0ABQ6Q2N8_9BACT|nr:hypothetical protein Ataiwa_15490 [Algoriphagus taiwanensis]